MAVQHFLLVFKLVSFLSSIRCGTLPYATRPSLPPERLHDIHLHRSEIQPTAPLSLSVRVSPSTYPRYPPIRGAAPLIPLLLGLPYGRICVRCPLHISVCPIRFILPGASPW